MTSSAPRFQSKSTVDSKSAAYPSEISRLLRRAHRHQERRRSRSEDLFKSSLRLTLVAIIDVMAVAAMRAVGVMDWAGAAFQRAVPIGADAVGFSLWPVSTALLAALTLLGAYGEPHGVRDPMRIAAASAVATIVSAWNVLWAVGSPVAAGRLAIAATILTGFLVLGRLLAVWFSRRIGLLKVRRLRTVFVGSEIEVARSSSGPGLRDAAAVEIVGRVALSDAARDTTALGTVADLEAVLMRERADAVVMCSGVEEDDFLQVVEAARGAGCELLSVPLDFTLLGVEPNLIWINGQAFVDLSSPAIRNADRVVKRAFDVGAATLGLIALLPLFVLVALVVKLDSKGPIFYQSPRWGRFGRRIGIWKFRTMVQDADELLKLNPSLQKRFAANIKIEDDPRITRVGRFLRKWSIDELPQLWNVVSGDLSLVGPRPKLIGEESRYGAAIEAVLSVRPGITGLWQVSGRNNTSYEQRVALDVKYATHPSFAEDLRILLRTVPVVLRGTGAQ